jgi:phage replication-related protein YjqB (UPF0714/DUF867 family)
MSNLSLSLFPVVLMAPLMVCGPARSPGGTDVELMLYHRHMHAPGARDRYTSFADLRRVEDRRRTRRYRIVRVDRGAAVSVLAIHGGLIEYRTSEVARVLAGDRWNLYLFEGTVPRTAWRLHITSRRFDEPGALDLVARSQHCVTVHGFTPRQAGGAFDTRTRQLCIGGRNPSLRRAILDLAGQRELPFSVGTCPPMLAEEPENLVNRCLEGGIQLELSRGLRLAFSREPAVREALVRLVKDTLAAVAGPPR